MKMSFTRLVPSGGSKGASEPCLCPSFRWLLAALGVHSLPSPCPDILPGCLCPNVPPLKRAPVIGLGATLIQDDLILPQSHLQRPYL